MSALTALRAGLRTLSEEPASVGPHYLLAVGVTFAARTPLLLGGGLALLLLQWQGRIGPVVSRLDQVDWQTTDPSIPPALQEAFSGLVTPGTVVIGVLSLLATVVLLVLARGVAGAATLNALSAGIEDSDPDRDPLLAGTAGIVEDWQTFVAIVLVRGGVVAGAGAVGVVAIGLAATGIGALVGIPLLLFTLSVALVVLLLLAFAGPAIAVDDVGAVGAMSASVRFPLRQPVAVLLYVLVATAVFVTMVVCAAVFNVVGVPRLSALLALLAAKPLVDAVKIGLYAETGTEAEASEWKYPVEASTESTESNTEAMSEATAEDDSASPSLRERSATGLRRGFRELVGFVRARLGLVLAGIGTLLLGGALGWQLTAPYGTKLAPPTDVASVFGTVAIAPFVNIAVNNWLVAVAQAFGGIGLGIPTAVNLLFNGVLVGGLAGVFDPLAFVVLVVPHALIEVPALGISGGLGYHLGVVAYRAFKGQKGVEAVAERLQRAAWVMVGLIPLFVLASFVEAFITPRIAAAVLGG